MRYTSLTAALVLVGLASGCQSSPVRELAATSESATYRVCECWAELGASSEAACRANADLANEAQLMCAEDVYFRYESSAQAPFDCVLDAARDLETCVFRVSGCDTEAFRACLEAYGARAGTCPELPPSAAADFQACSG